VQIRPVAAALTQVDGRTSKTNKPFPLLTSRRQKCCPRKYHNISSKESKFSLCLIYTISLDDKQSLKDTYYNKSNAVHNTVKDTVNGVQNFVTTCFDQPVYPQERTYVACHLRHFIVLKGRFMTVFTISRHLSLS